MNDDSPVLSQTTLTENTTANVFIVEHAFI